MRQGVFSSSGPPGSYVGRDPKIEGTSGTGPETHETTILVVTHPDGLYTTEGGTLGCVIPVPGRQGGLRLYRPDIDEGQDFPCVREVGPTLRTSVLWGRETGGYRSTSHLLSLCIPHLKETLRLPNPPWYTRTKPRRTSRSSDSSLLTGEEVWVVTHPHHPLWSRNI